VVPVESSVYYRRDTVRLFLARAVKGDVRVSCGFGEDPNTLPMDVGRLMPVLARYAVPVTGHAHGSAT
jgi:hypothetical protein